MPLLMCLLPLYVLIWVSVFLLLKKMPNNIFCDVLYDNVPPLSWKVRAMQEPWRSLHQCAELWKGLLPSRRGADFLLPLWLRAAGWSHHLLYPWAPVTVEQHSSRLQRSTIPTHSSKHFSFDNCLHIWKYNANQTIFDIFNCSWTQRLRT